MYISETNSTNTLLRQLLLLPVSNELRTRLLSEHLPIIRTDYQTAGRGQQGNSWESERGKNLLFSILLQDTGLCADAQWRISMFIPSILCKVLEKHLNPLQQEQLSIKWPNDIYFGDRKLAGILIEHSLLGQKIEYSIIGIGLNINQTSFTSAPNPISMKQITGKEINLEEIMLLIRDAVETEITTIHNEPFLRQSYMQHLYRRNGYFPYVEREVSTMPTMNETKCSSDTFYAQIETITPQGQLVLRLRSGELKTYHFKQIRYVIE